MEVKQSPHQRCMERIGICYIISTIRFKQSPHQRCMERIGVCHIIPSIRFKESPPTLFGADRGLQHLSRVPTYALTYGESSSCCIFFRIIATWYVYIYVFVRIRAYIYVYKKLSLREKKNEKSVLAKFIYVPDLW